MFSINFDSIDTAETLRVAQRAHACSLGDIRPQSEPIMAVPCWLLRLVIFKNFDLIWFQAPPSPAWEAVAGSAGGRRGCAGRGFCFFTLVLVLVRAFFRGQQELRVSLRLPTAV